MLYTCTTLLAFAIATSALASDLTEPLRLSGSPAEIGKQHGAAAGPEIRLMIKGYIGRHIVEDKLKPRAQTKIDVMRPSLPTWYMEELQACAKAAKVDPDVLLYAQCEGDVGSLPGCTTYAAYGPASRDDKMRIGRNFDYSAPKSISRLARVFVFQPKQKGHHAFLSVGWTGILGGWTFYNEKGLFVANNLGGFSNKNPRGIPTLILQRIIAQRAATVEEAITMIRKMPRMRGQVLILAHAGAPSKGIRPSAAMVTYDAKRAVVTRPNNGFVFHTSLGTDRDEVLRQAKTSRGITAPICSAGVNGTLHSVAISPDAGIVRVAHGRKEAAHLGVFTTYKIADLFKLKQLTNTGP